MKIDHEPCHTEIGSLTAQAVAMAETLHTILLESVDADVCRLSLSALQGTVIGRNYLAANPIQR